MDIPCKTDQRAPHGFLRNASHDEVGYVCECEYWETESNANHLDDHDYPLTTAPCTIQQA